MAQWDAEIQVNAELVGQLIQAQFPQVKLGQVKLLGEGWDNYAFSVNEDLIFRFPRRSATVEPLETENRVLPQIAPYLSLNIPVPIYLGVPSKLYPWSFAGYPRVSGQTACQAHLEQIERAKIARPLGEFLRSLHSIPQSLFPSLALPGDKLGRLDRNKRLPVIKENLKKIRDLNLLEAVPALLNRVNRWEKEFTKSPVELTLYNGVAHGDLYSRHLLVDSSHQLCGVIDWGDVHCGHPAVDLAVVHSFVPPDAHEEFKKSYGLPIDEKTWDLAQFRALSHSCYVLLYAYEIQDQDLLRESLQSLIYISSVC